MKSITFLVAMDYEIQNIFDLNEFEVKSEKPFKQYVHKSSDVKIIETGIGKSNSSAAAQYAIGLNSDLYVNIGLVGSFDNNVEIGSISKVSKCKFWDVDVTALDFKPGQIPFNGLDEYAFTNSEFDDLIKEKRKIVSGDSFVSDTKVILDFIGEFQPEILDMEIASIAHVFHINDKSNDLISIKAVSDYLNQNSSEDFYKNREKAFGNLKKVVGEIVG